MLYFIASISWIGSDLVTDKFHLFWALIVALVMTFVLILWCFMDIGSRNFMGDLVWG